MRLILFLVSFLLLSACSSAPTGGSPPWTRNPTRTVDSGYLVYVGRGEGATLERATFEAEGSAINDLAHECSFAPKGARIEDRYDERIEGGARRAFVKVGLLFEECEGAKKAIEPEDVRKLANVPMAETLKRYNEGTAAETKAGEGPISDPAGYVAARGEVVDAKQTVILSSTVDREVYFARVRPLVTRIQVYETVNPAVRETPPTWSSYRHERAAVVPAPPPPRESVKPTHERRPGRVKRRHRR